MALLLALLLLTDVIRVMSFRELVVECVGPMVFGQPTCLFVKVSVMTNNVDAHVHACTNGCTHNTICTHARVHTHTHTHTHTNTHTHTHTL